MSKGFCIAADPDDKVEKLCKVSRVASIVFLSQVCVFLFYKISQMCCMNIKGQDVHHQGCGNGIL